MIVVPSICAAFCLLCLPSRLLFFLLCSASPSPCISTDTHSSREQAQEQAQEQKISKISPCNRNKAPSTRINQGDYERMHGQATIRPTTFRDDMSGEAHDRESEGSKVRRLSIVKGQRINVKAHCQDDFNGRTRGDSIAEHSRSGRQAGKEATEIEAKVG
ncbi:hypothetical protein B0O80DRAFT_464780 [Mortierella sp. GBAus27b]|nr:hypothetical protein B0O80DRAFT_464780 [Mortierella sp. GBAus27b]